MNDGEATPLMRQYREIKRVILALFFLFRVGDFYEMFDQDAREASALLSIALTCATKPAPTRFRCAEFLIMPPRPTLPDCWKAGRTVALCEQVEDPKLAKGLVRREVVRMFTPGTLVDMDFFLLRRQTSWRRHTIFRPEGSAEGRIGDRFGLPRFSTGEFGSRNFKDPMPMPS